MKGVFISYRQDDAKPYALLLRQDLVEAFGEENVFLDKDTLHAGSWREQIQAALDRSGVALIVIGRRWLTSADSRGQRRLDLPDDVHRHEIAVALSRKDVTVSNGSRVRARIATINPAADLAFLRAEVTGSLTPLGLAPQLISQGDEVIAILQSADDEWLVAPGHVSRVAVDTAEFGEARIEVDIAEHLGSPVVNTRGEVIGVMQGSFKDRPDHTFLIPAHVIKETLGTGLVTPSQ